MVFMLDEGSVFDASIDKVWRFMREGREEHKHGARSNVKVETEGRSIVISFDVEGPDGRVTRIKNKTTEFAPIGRTVEYVEGPLAGSKAVTYYIPLGDKTGITVVGEYVSHAIPEGKIKEMVLAQAERSFNEDQENLKRFK